MVYCYRKELLDDWEKSFEGAWRELPAGTFVSGPCPPGTFAGSAPESSRLDRFIDQAITTVVTAAGAIGAAYASSQLSGATFGASNEFLPSTKSMLSEGIGTIANYDYDVDREIEPMWEDADWEGTFDVGDGDSGEWGEMDMGGLGGGVVDLPSVISAGAGMLPRMLGGGAIGGAVAAAGAGVVGLWAKLRGAAGGAAGNFIINGVKGRVADLWPAVRKYGPHAVAAALGIGAASLAEILAQAPMNATRRRRGRGISASDIRRAKRVIRFNRRLSAQLGTGRGRARGRSYYPRGRAHYH